MADDKTFTQAEMDSIIEGRLARERQKYADYEDLREKASKYDEYQAQNKTELQKEKEKSDALQAKLSALEKKDTVRQVREKTAKDTGVGGHCPCHRRNPEPCGIILSLLDFLSFEAEKKPFPWEQIIAQATFPSLCSIHEHAGKNCQVQGCRR